MDISFEQFKEEVGALEIKMKNHFEAFETPSQLLAIDGIVDDKYYYDSAIKIMWILKEPYNKNDGDGSWHISKNLIVDVASGKNKAASATWQPIIYTTYGILNNIDTLDKMPKINKSLVSSVLNQISFINLQKLNSKTRTDDALLKEYYEANREILLAQIKTYRPDIVIGGNTLHLLENDLQILEENKLPFGHFSKDKMLFINTKHPAQTKIRRSEYVKEIILRAKENENVYS